MYNIASFLEKFKNVGLKERFAKETISMIVSEECGVRVGVEMIQYKNGVISLKVPLSQKSQVYIKKGQILKRCEREVVGMVVKDIR
jgi:hypothetical protein